MSRLSSTSDVSQRLHKPRKPVWTSDPDDDEDEDLEEDEDNPDSARCASMSSQGEDSSLQEGLGLQPPCDSVFLYHKKRASAIDDYVERVARTPNKIESLRKRSVSTPNLSGRKTRECSKGLAFDPLPPSSSTSSMREWLDSQKLVSATKTRGRIQQSGFIQKLSPVVDGLESTPGIRVSSHPRETTSPMKLKATSNKENCPPMKIPNSVSRHPPRPSSALMVAECSSKKLPNFGPAISWAPSPVPRLPAEFARTPSQPSINCSLDRRRLGLPAGSFSSIPVAAVAGTCPQAHEINGKIYLATDFIGRGGSCKVYQASDPNGQTVAIKIVDLQGLEDEMASEYRNEVKILAKLQGSGQIVKLIEYEFKEAENVLYVVMEKGECDFGVYLRERRFKLHPIELRYFWLQMLTAVQQIHSEGIIHSDLKPGNFLVVKGQLKLIDFGIASSLRAEATKVTRLAKAGTYNFISPEALSEIAYDDDCSPAIKIGIKSDIWSLGSILHLMAFGAAPFGHIAKLHEKEKAICDPSVSIKIPPKGGPCDPDLVDVLKRCLVRDPVERASSDELLRHRFLCPSVEPVPSSVDELVEKTRLLSPKSKREFFMRIRDA